MTVDVSLTSLRTAQFALAAELAARDWPNIAYFEVFPVGQERRCTEWLAIVDLEDGGVIKVSFETPFKVDARRRPPVAATEPPVLERHQDQIEDVVSAYAS